MKPLVYGSVCSGVEAASLAWEPLGWRCSFVSEIEPFPSAVLAHRYPETPNLGDFTQIETAPQPIGLLVGGTPCQAFSLAGLRKGMDDERGVLALEFLRLAGRLRPDWLVWENVAGVLSINGGRDFGAFLGGLVQLGYGFAYRVLDAQYFGVPQRRRRVFVVGRLGDWRPAVAVLFDRHCLSGDLAPRRETGAFVASALTRSLGSGGPDATKAQANHVVATDTPTVARRLTAHRSGRLDGDTETFIAHTLRGEGFDASEDGTGRGTPLVPVAFNPQAGGKQTTLGYDPESRTTGTLTANQKPAVAGSAVRRLTPRECERLQGMPDDWTLVPYRGKLAADGPRYRAIGNSMAVPCMAWIGRRIDAVRAALAAA